MADNGTTQTTALDAEKADLLAELATARWVLTNTTRELSDEQATSMARPA